MKTSALHKAAWILPFLLVLGAALIARALVEGERRESDRVSGLVAAHVRDELEADLMERVRCLSRMARRWEIAGPPSRAYWEADATQIVRDAPDLQAVEWVSPALRIAWVEPLQGNERAFGLNLRKDARRATALLRARDTGRTTVSRPIDLVQGGKGFLAYVPIVRDGRFEGLIVGVFRLGDALASLPAARSGRTIALSEGGAPVLSVGDAASDLQTAYGRDIDFQLVNARWTLRVTPSAATLAKYRSALPTVVLLGGVIAAAMTGALLLALGATRRASLDLRESEAKFRTAIETMQEGLIVRDRRGGVVVANGRVAEIFGLDPDQVTGRRTVPEGWLTTHEDGRTMPHDEWPSFVALETGVPQKDGTMGIRMPTGETVWTSYSSVPLFHPGEAHAYAVVTTFADVTIRKRREERTRRQIERANDANAELAEANARLSEAAHTDGLTGLCNRRAFDESLATEIEASRESGRPLSLVLLDVDQFKSYNDRFGHPAGDEALRRVGRILAAVCRPEDQPARYGGEEFAVLLIDADAVQATAIAERFRRAIEAAPWERREITASFGVATLFDGDGATFVAEADAALYRAKAEGRNRVVHHEKASLARAA